jgi:hypothetical protein
MRTPPPPTRRNRNFSYMVLLGKWITKQAAFGKMNYSDVAKAYESTGVVWPTNTVQISKLGVFWRFGNEYKYEAVLWLDEWQEHRKGKLSVYDTLLDEIRWKLATRKAKT